MVLSALSMGVLGGVVPKPYEMNSSKFMVVRLGGCDILTLTATTTGALRPHIHATGLPIPPYSLSTLMPEPSSAVVVPYPIPSPSNTSVVAASHSLSTSYAVSTSSPEASLTPLSISNSFNATAQNSTFVYSPPSLSATMTSPYSVPTPGYVPVVVEVVCETVYYSAKPSSSVTLTAVLSSGEHAKPSSVAPSSAAVTNILPGLAIAALGQVDGLTGSSINLPLLSSILIPDVNQQSIFTTTTTTTTTVVLTLPTPLLPTPSDVENTASATTTTTVVVLPTDSSSMSVASTSTSDSEVPSSSTADSASSILSTVAVTTSTPPSSSDSNTNTAFPTAPPFSYNPSASRGSASPISRPTPEPSSALVAGSTLSASTVPTSTSTFISQYTGIPPAPSAAGASGISSKRNKERVWWVAYFVPLLFLA
jgi:hypothetical protein